MLKQLNKIPWSTLEHAYGTAEDVPELLRKLLDTDPAVRSSTLWTLNPSVASRVDPVWKLYRLVKDQLNSEG